MARREQGKKIIITGCQRVERLENIRCIINNEEWKSLKRLTIILFFSSSLSLPLCQNKSKKNGGGGGGGGGGDDDNDHVDDDEADASENY